MLKDSSNSKHWIYRRNVYECINIYKVFKDDKYCNAGNEENSSICGKLRAFYNTHIS